MLIRLAQSVSPLLLLLLVISIDVASSDDQDANSQVLEDLGVDLRPKGRIGNQITLTAPQGDLAAADARF